jgi:hypothetical protein
MQIEYNEQYLKHDSSIRDNLLSLSNVIELIWLRRLESPAKHDFARISTERGMQIECNEQHWKHDSSIRDNLLSLSNVIELIWLRRLEAPAKHDFPRISTERGMQIECNEHHRKHDSSIRDNLDSDSNVIDFSFELWKLARDRISTERGMQIECNEQQLKHNSSIRFNLDSDSNVIDSSLEPRKLARDRISTERGMQIECNEQYLKHDSSIRFNLDSDSNVIDSKLEPEKLALHRASTERGMQIECKEQHLKHDSSIRDNLLSLSNVIDVIWFDCA